MPRRSRPLTSGETDSSKPDVRLVRPSVPGAGFRRPAQGPMRALRTRVERRDALIEAVREANATRDPQSRRVARSPGPGLDPRAVLGGRRPRPERPLNVIADKAWSRTSQPSLWSAANWVMRHGWSSSRATSPRTRAAGPAAGSSWPFR